MEEVKPSQSPPPPLPPNAPPATTSPDINPGFVPLHAWTIALSYLLIAILWIYFSDQILVALAPDQASLVRWSTYKGIGFVLVTGGLLLLLIWRALAALDKAYRAVRQSEERFRLLAQATSDAAWDWNLQTGDRWWSDGIHRLRGAPPDNKQPGPMWEEFVHPHDRERVKKELQTAVAQSTPNWLTTYRILGVDGEALTVEDRALLLTNENGVPVRMVGGLTDISQRLTLEDHLRKVQRMEAVGQLTGGLAHDFNNLLTVILGNAENLEQTLEKQPRAREQAALIFQAAERGADLTRRLLTFARQQTLTPQAVDIKQLTSGLAPLLRRTLGGNIDILFGHDAGLPQALVDPAQLEQALLNLCVNARDAMPRGGNLIITTVQTTISDDDAMTGRATLEDGPAAGHYLVVSVTDTGTGIDPAHIGHIFEPFYTTKAHDKGTGLGLAMVYGFIRQSGGHITVSSRPGQTTFKLYLPVAHGESEPVPLRKKSQPPAGGGESILLVDDNDLVRQFATGQLESLGYRVVTATSGEEALEILAGGETVDLLFTDVLMPGLDGKALAQRAQALQPKLKVLYTTGFSGPDCDDTADHNVLRKPYNRADLDRQVRQALANG